MESQYIPVATADAIADLCLPTGNDRLDILNSVFIDLVQRGYLYPVCTRDNPTIVYFPTEAGKRYALDNYPQAVEEARDDY